ncbi:MAG TPA: ABC transporter ATP-binding protein [Bacteroidetes bacterium]|nr:ABC transporter ATP-binding protein [Bacteroidota bacterium]
MLYVNNLTKLFGENTAVDKISFHVKKGSVFGLLGSNGAGKTTLIRMINRILMPDSGEIRFDGSALKPEHISRIGYLPEERGLYPKMKVGEQLMFLAQIKGLSSKQSEENIKYWFEKLSIEDWWHKKTDQLSKGMQQKVQFIATVINEPELLILDEPFTGLDPVNTRIIKEEISRLNKKGASIIFSTHRMEQVESICNEIVIVNHGKLVLEGDLNKLKQEFKKNSYSIELSEYKDIKYPFEIIETNNKPGMMFRLEKGQSPNQVLEFFIHNGIEVKSFKEVLPSLNDIFIEVVKN